MARARSLFWGQDGFGDFGVLAKNKFGARISAFFSTLLPEREFLHYKTDVGMQVIRLTTRAQLLALALLAMICVYFAVATRSLVHETAAATSTQGEIAAMRQELASLRAGVATTAARVEQRQAFLAALLTGSGDPATLAELLPQAAAPFAAGAGALEPLLAAERRQLGFVTDAKTAAEARFQRNAALLDRLGVGADRFMKQSSLGMGGPEEASDAVVQGADPSFKALFLSWKKLDMLEKGMAAVPSLKPVANYTYTSGYGLRYDPFSGSAAMHRGVDLAGAVGEPIRAAANGVIVKAGWVSGYGNYVEIDHGSGISTRYGHMSRFAVRSGDRVGRGEQIGAMGSTGRSTGSHLHYEVHIDGEAVNPMPFLEASDYVLAAQDRRSTLGVGGPALPAKTPAGD
jgi:murein DD-endopeptidase MepM/ murein hydrolase activator NlpD